MRYLVDTDWVIHYLNGHAEIVTRLQEFGPQRIALSLISLAELYEGVLYSRDPDKSAAGLQAFLRGVVDGSCSAAQVRTASMRAPARNRKLSSALIP